MKLDIKHRRSIDCELEFLFKSEVLRDDPHAVHAGCNRGKRILSCRIGVLALLRARADELNERVGNTRARGVGYGSSQSSAWRRLRESENRKRQQPNCADQHEHTSPV